MRRTSRARRAFHTVLAATMVASTLAIAADNADAATFADAGFFEQTFASGLSGPIGMAFMPDGRLLVAEQSGIVKLVQANGTVGSTPFVDLSNDVNGVRDRGLLGIEIHPDFPASPYVYLLYTYDPPETSAFTGNAGPDGKGARASRLVRVTADAATNYATSDGSPPVVLMGSNSTAANIGDLNAGMNDFSQTVCEDDVTGDPIQDCLPADGESHTIGSVRFGTDGMLYVGNGDASSYTQVDARALRSLDLDSMAGKIFRIDPITGQGMSSNPFWDGDPDSNRSKVHSFGLRNPFRFTVDPNSGNLFIGDVGWGAWEEINTGSGADFGWPCYEGGSGSLVQQSGYAGLTGCADYYPTASATPAVYAWDRTGQGGAALAGVVYTGTGVYPPEFTDGLFIADYADGWIKYLPTDGAGNILTDPSGDAIVEPVADAAFAPVDFAQGPDGHVYYVNIVTNSIVRLSYDDSVPPPAVRYEYYEGSFSVLPDFDTLSPISTGFISEFSLSPARQLNDYAFRYRSCLDVPAAGSYTFYTTSDDGSKLFIDGVEVVDNDGLHGAVEQSGTASLSQGSVPIEVQFFELSGADTLTVSWESAAISKQTIPSDALIPCDAPVTATPTSVDFGTVSSPTTQTVRVSHGGASTEPAVELTTIGFSGPNAADYGSTQLLPATIQPGAFIDVPVTFDPQSVGSSSGTMTISHTGTTPDVVVALSGSAQNNPPTIQILEPADGQVAEVGSVVTLSATADDAEDGPGGVTVEWEGILHHGEHTHPNEFTASGTSGSFTFNDHDDNTYIEVCATATDTLGSTTTQCVDVVPLTVDYTFDSVPSGLDLSYNGVTYTTPFTIETVVGADRSINAPLTQSGYSFDSWSIGGTASQTITIAATPQTITANYACGALAQEAEDAALNGLFTVGSSATASGGEFISVPEGTGSIGAIDGVNFAEFCFTVADAGDYTIEGIVDGLDGGSDSFFVTVDDTPAAGYLWDVPPGWISDPVSDRNGQNPVIVNLTPGDHTVQVHLRDDGTRLDTLELVPVSTPPGPSCTTGIQEAENAALFGSFTTGSNVLASGGAYAEAPQGSGSSNSAPDGLNYAEFCFTVADAGDYTIEGVVNGPNGGSNSFFVTVDDTPVGGYIWDVASDWVVDPVSDRNGQNPVIVNLTPGDHTVQVHLREDGTQLDTLELVPVSTPPGPSCTTGIQEAENAALFGSFTTGSNVLASGGAYAEAPQGSGSSNSAPDGLNYAEFCFTVADAGDYTIEGVVNGPNGGSNSFFVTVDDTPVGGYIWDVASDWVVDPVSDRNGQNPVIVNLTPGDHTVQVHLREDGTQLDTLELVPVSTPPGPSCTTGIQEAENAALFGSFTTGNDAGASGGAYAHTPQGSGSAGAIDNLNYVEFCFTVAEAGNYTLDATVDGPDGGSDSFFVTVNDLPTGGYLWDTTAGWIADQVSDRNGQNPVIVNLTPGDHTVQVHLREDGARIDTLELVAAP